MILFVARQPLLAILHWVQRLLFCFGLAAISYCAWVFADAWIFQYEEDQMTHQWPAPSPPGVLVPLDVVASVSGPPPKTVGPGPAGEPLARLDIERLNLSVIVVEGASAFVLAHAAGHIPGTALPGQGHNIGISAHRDSYFRPLRDIQLGDVVILITRDARHHYRVVSTRIVTPVDVSVLDPGATEALTLITCYPFYFVGPAPSRFVVRAERI